ncbi:MAG: hypothetical protein RUDDFDWM_000505 [Candidatus Fervidibacterota bacterium]
MFPSFRRNLFSLGAQTIIDRKGTDVKASMPVLFTNALQCIYNLFGGKEGFISAHIGGVRLYGQSIFKA